jgi:hypothetical protein
MRDRGDSRCTAGVGGRMTDPILTLLGAGVLALIGVGVFGLYALIVFIIGAVLGFSDSTE